ncbi:hypothetical protein LELG_05687 [Lodderomyces elongisporus NRRL YB-4239]|uniref:CDP-diacylglycerol--inositol 3-phosphatidyltransferase n=1 Tax=Lodderomyces elongisporus (strain ATCC 11503 / CBS 2605 / JCM 1781 / NBRC 1676 / NRRL YB-4239) TaxID=379508 RepID=A5E7U8_LODEL|nr:hypothetical protein LELG_05687 [Lodderomyces elongisporus NRRL YB-4239]
MTSSTSQSLSIAKEEITVQTIFLYIPNIIGYLRIVTAVISFICMSRFPITTVIFYGISSFLDAFDGYAARKFNQGTRFGAVLDMVTDRCATSSLIVYLAIIYPRFTVIWQLLVSLDLASHYIHMYGMLSAGSLSHKNVEASQSKLLNLYYTNRKVLFAVCALNELFYVAIYLKYYGFFWLGTVMAVLSTPIWVFKQIANVIQLQSALLILARMDVEEHKNKKR